MALRRQVRSVSCEVLLAWASLSACGLLCVACGRGDGPVQTGMQSGTESRGHVDIVLRVRGREIAAALISCGSSGMDANGLSDLAERLETTRIVFLADGRLLSTRGFPWDWSARAGTWAVDEDGDVIVQSGRSRPNGDAFGRWQPDGSIIIREMATLNMGCHFIPTLVLIPYESD